MEHDLQENTHKVEQLLAELEQIRSQQEHKLDIEVFEEEIEHLKSCVQAGASSNLSDKISPIKRKNNLV